MLFWCILTTVFLGLDFLSSDGDLVDILAIVIIWVLYSKI